MGKMIVDYFILWISIQIIKQVFLLNTVTNITNMIDSLEHYYVILK